MLYNSQIPSIEQQTRVKQYQTFNNSFQYTPTYLHQYPNRSQIVHHNQYRQNLTHKNNSFTPKQTNLACNNHYHQIFDRVAMGRRRKQNCKNQDLGLIENQKYFKPNYVLKDKLANHIRERWVSYGREPINKLQRQEKENQKLYAQIQMKMERAKNKVMSEKKYIQKNEDQRIRIQEEVQSIRSRRENQKKETSRSITPQSKSKNIQELEKQYLAIQYQNFKAVKNSIQDQKQLKEQIQTKQKQNSTCFKKIQQKQMQQDKKESKVYGKCENEKNAVEKIKNRLSFSSIVYQDSNHRTVNHEKMHLVNKFQNEVRLRKQLISKICCEKNVEEKYRIILN